MRGWIIAALLALGLAAPAAAQIIGPARVIDGDTLEIAGERLRLLGVDAPESDQFCATEQGIDWACGQWVTQELRALLARAQVSCRGEARDRYGRLLARCSLDGADLNARLVRDGMAWVNPRYELTYLPQEAEAAVAMRGLWAMRSKRPWEHRATRGVGRHAPDPACAIKGNLSENGRIYHLPGQAHYDRTRIDTRRGEAWFCSEAEARAAGWRAARR